MRINVIVDKRESRPGWVDANPFEPLPCEAGETEEIMAMDSLDRVPVDQVDQILSHWLSRLAHGGKLTLGIVDLKEACRGILAGTIELDAANELLHGTAEMPRRCSLSLGQLVEVLKSKGLKVLMKRITGTKAFVTCQRP